MPDPISDLRAHVDAAHAAADKLVQEATERARAAEEASRAHNRNTPPSGWEARAPEEESAGVTPDLAAIMGLLEAARGAIPDEISTQLAEAVRELLLALRALIDWYIDRLESLATSRPATDRDVEDIPIS
jgi:hypothetical protein